MGVRAPAYLQHNLFQLELFLSHLICRHRLVVIQAEQVIFLQDLLEVLLGETHHAVLAIVGGEVQPLFCPAGGQEVDPQDKQASPLHLGEV